jgi:hypothetical protein
MDTIIEFNDAAFRHGVTEADIWSAVDKFIYDSPFPGYANKHTMKCRKTYRRLVNKGGKYA